MTFHKRVRLIKLWFRQSAVGIALAIIIIAFGAILLLLAQSQNKLSEQSDQNKRILLQLQGVTDRLEKGADLRTEQFNSINRHLDCIVEFFSQPDRSDKAIANIDTCELEDIDTGGGNSSTAPSATTNPAPQVANPTPNQPTPSTSNNGNKDAPPSVEKCIANVNVLWLIPVKIGC